MHLPFGFDIGNGANIVLCGEHELVVDDPFGLMIETGRRMQLHHLIVFNGKVMSRALQMSRL